MKRILILVILLCTIFVSVKVALTMYMAKNLNLSENTVFTVEKGVGLSTIAHQLSQKGIIVYPKLLVKIGQFEGYSKKLKYGEYWLTPTDTYQELLEKIISGDNVKYKVTFVEGDHMYKYAEQIEQAGLGKATDFLSLARDPSLIKEVLGETQKSLEGYLYPETYHFAKNDGVKTIIRTMVGKFNEETKNLNFNKFNMTKHQVITLASIIEKETGAGMERELVSSVFHNRMKKKMRLQTDPTIIYGILDKTGKEITNIRKVDITAPTDYNTYVIAGLPPGPISNPSIASIRAALNPEQTEYLFFVSQNDGTHVFTTNYKDHLKAVKKFQLNSKNREGKSWRDLKKKTSK